MKPTIARLGKRMRSPKPFDLTGSYEQAGLTRWDGLRECPDRIERDVP